ncbi:MAG: hypothetical protein EPN93_15230 [Spirochaetes bacterium]|nr:MAG: hypothetical protein EPN93_15230 [Spirochaetota bacterium]
MERFTDIHALVDAIERAHKFKKKRLSFMKRASVNAEIIRMRDSFDLLWRKDGEDYRLRNPSLSKGAIDILAGIFGKKEEAGAIQEADRALCAIDRLRFNHFLSATIASVPSVNHLYELFFGPGERLERLACDRIPYLERYLPTMGRIGTDMEALVLSKADIDTLWEMIQLFDVIRENLQKDTALYARFRKDFRGHYREGGELSILGYGEISTVMSMVKGRVLDRSFELQRVEGSKWVWKRMPPFPSREEVDRYDAAYREYRALLVAMGIAVPEQALSRFDYAGALTVYAGQARINPDFVAHVLLRRLDTENAKRLFFMVLRELEKVFAFNARGGGVRIGIDGQLSNWVLDSKGGALNYVHEGDGMFYIDTSTPLFRKEGREQMNPEVFIMTTPSFLRWVVRRFFLQEVLDRYYDLRLVIVDIIANLHKEQMPGLIPHFIPMANAFIDRLGITGGAITREEVDKYYSGDAFIWKFYQFARRIDRFITESILRKKYSYRLPGKIKR